MSNTAAVDNDVDEAGDPPVQIPDSAFQFIDEENIKKIQEILSGITFVAPAPPVAKIPTVLFYGARGWIASYFTKELEKNGRFRVIAAEARADDPEKVEEEIDRVLPDRVVSFVGRTHGEDIPTIDYLEKPGKLPENIRDNLFAPVVLAIICARRGVHFTYLGTGCIFSDVDPASTPESEAYDENSVPNFFGSSYSTVKGFTDKLMHMFGRSALNVRIRMPITADMSPRNFIAKIVKYDRVCSISNSMSVLPTLLPRLADMIYRGSTGTVNLVNPGIISHDEILGMYRDIVDPTYTWKNMTIEEQDAMLASKRSNNRLDTSVLRSEYPLIPNIRDAIRMCLEDIREDNDKKSMIQKETYESEIFALENIV